MCTHTILEFLILVRTWSKETIIMSRDKYRNKVYRYYKNKNLYTMKKVSLSLFL